MNFIINNIYFNIYIQIYILTNIYEFHFINGKALHILLTGWNGFIFYHFYPSSVIKICFYAANAVSFAEADNI